VGFRIQDSGFGIQEKGRRGEVFPLNPESRILRQGKFFP
jgi:hypothetical protein